MTKPKRKADPSTDKMSKMKGLYNKDTKKVKITKEKAETPIASSSLVHASDSSHTTSSPSSIQTTPMPSTCNSWQSTTSESLQSDCSGVASEHVETSGMSTKIMRKTPADSILRDGASRIGNTSGMEGTVSLSSNAQHNITRKVRWAQVNLDSSIKYRNNMNGNVVYMDGVNQKLTELNPKEIAGGIHNICGPVVSVQSLTSGKLMITTKTPEQAVKLRNAKKLSGKYDILVNMAWNKQIKCGKVYSTALQELSLDEILDSLLEQNVVGVRKLYNNPNHSCHWYVVAFLDEIPKEIAIEYLKLKVQQYYPSPLMCLKCYKYGHTTSSCRNAARCVKCGASGHKSNECQNSEEIIKCSNCKQNHSPTSKLCTYYRNEIEVCKLKVQLNITFKEAREKLARQKLQNNVQERKDEDMYSSLQSLPPLTTETEQTPSAYNFNLPTLQSQTGGRTYSETVKQQKISNMYHKSFSEATGVNPAKIDRQEIKQQISEGIKSALDNSIAEIVSKMLPVIMRLFLSSSVAEKAECFAEIGEFLGMERVVRDNLNEIAIPIASCPP